MTAASNHRCDLLTEKIAELLRSGIQAGPDVMEYIDSTCGNPTVEEIKALIEEQGGSERETLVELIFFPDEEIQVQLEKILEQQVYTAEDAAAICGQLASRNLSATVALADTGRTLSVQVDRSVVDPFVNRLNIDFTLDADLNRTVEEAFPADDRRAVRVRLRNARMRPSGNLREVLLRCIRAMGDGRLCFEELDFLLEFLQEPCGDAGFFEAMMKKKRRCSQHLHRVEGIEKKRRQNNFETLLLQGERYPYIDRGRTLKTIAAIDRICLAVFGRTETVETVDESDTNWEVRGAEDAARMFRLLSL